MKQALNHGLKLKKIDRVITINQRAWLKPYIDMNTELRKNAKSEFENDFFKLMNNFVFGKTMEHVRNHRDIKLVTPNKRRKRLLSEPNYHLHKNFSNPLMAIEIKKTFIKMIKPLYLGMSILNIRKTLINDGDKAKLRYADTDSFVVHIKTEYLFEGISNDVGRWFDTSNYDENYKRPLSIGKNKNVAGLFKGELGGKIITEAVTLRAKTYAYLIVGYWAGGDDDDYEKIR